MRVAVAVLLLAVPVAALAQTSGAPPARGMTRDQFVQRAATRAGQVFDAIDVNRSGTITRDQLRAYRQAHAAQRPQN